MKLVTFQAPDRRIAIGCVDVARRTVLDLQYMHTLWLGQPSPVLDSMLALMRAGPSGLALVGILHRNGNSRAALHLPLDQVRLLAPVPVPEQIRVFSDRSEARVLMGGPEDAPAPAFSSTDSGAAEIYCRQPVYHISNRFNVIGADVDVTCPNRCDFLDVDAQLGVFVTGMRKNISIETAHQFIFGYALFSRFSTRDRQMMNMSGLTARPRGRSFDTSNAIGPWIVTPDEISNRAALEACLRVNGEVCAASTIGKLRQSFAEMIASVSRNETIYPGEFLGIGTLGCGCGRGFDRLLKSGDTVEFEIPGVGILRNRIVPAAP